MHTSLRFKYLLLCFDCFARTNTNYTYRNVSTPLISPRRYTETIYSSNICVNLLKCCSFRKRNVVPAIFDTGIFRVFESDNILLLSNACYVFVAAILYSAFATAYKYVLIPHSACILHGQLNHLSSVILKSWMIRSVLHKVFYRS